MKIDAYIENFGQSELFQSESSKSRKGLYEMKTVKSQLELLKLELERHNLSKERLMEIKQITRDIAHKLDTQCFVGSIGGMVEDLYRVETKYPKRRVKKVVRLLVEYVQK